MIKVKRLRTADCVVGGFRYESKSREVGSFTVHNQVRIADGRVEPGHDEVGESPARRLGASTLMRETGKQLLSNLRMLQNNWPVVPHPCTDVLVRAMNQLIIQLPYHCSLRAHNAVDICAVERRPV
jgi:hypothetical protein